MAILLKQWDSQLLEGRDIDINKLSGDSTAMMLNETAVKVMRFKEPRSVS